MSTGLCYCPCDRWIHTPAICEGTARRSLPSAPHREGFAHLPCCEACHNAITVETSRRAIEPKEPGKP